MKIMNKTIAVFFLIAGLTSWMWPGFNGFVASPSDISAGEGRIVGAVFFVGASIVWFLRISPENKS
jgi:hypothetical protein